MRPAAAEVAQAALRQEGIDAHAQARATLAAHRGGRWDPLDYEAARALQASGDRPEANRIQTWTFDQEEVWVNLYGDRLELRGLDEDYLLNIATFLMTNAARFASMWREDQVIQQSINPKFRLSLSRPRLRDAVEDPHRWMMKSPLMRAIWRLVIEREDR